MAVVVSAGLALSLLGLLLVLIVLEVRPRPSGQSGEGLGSAVQGLSAFLSALTAVAVVGAMMVQIRQFRTSQVQSIRTMQMELMGMLIQDPDLRPVSPTFPGVPIGQRKQAIFTNLVFRYLEVGLEIGYFTPKGVRLELLEQFRLPEIRKVWEGTRAKYTAGAISEARRRFVEIVEAAYRDSVPATYPGSTERGEDGSLRTPGVDRPATLLVAGLSFVVGIGAGVAVGRRRHPTRRAHRNRLGAPQR